MGEKNYVKHGYYMEDEYGNKSRLDKQYSTELINSESHLNYIIHDFFMFLESAGHSKEIISEALFEIIGFED